MRGVRMADIVETFGEVKSHPEYLYLLLEQEEERSEMTARHAQRRVITALDIRKRLEAET